MKTLYISDLDGTLFNKSKKNFILLLTLLCENGLYYKHKEKVSKQS